MDIFVRNVPPTLTVPRFKFRLSDIFHGPDYAHHSDELLNFEVRIFRSQRGRGPPVAIVSLPMEQVGRQFLNEYGGPHPRKFVEIGTRLRFTPSNRPIRPEVLDNIRRLSYTEPVLPEQEREIHQLEGQVVSIVTIQFGWVCPDDVFSVEWEKNRLNARMEYQHDRREFRIKVFEPRLVRSIAIRAAQIYWTAAQIDEPRTPVIFLYLNYAPSYESAQPEHDLINLFAQLMSPRSNPIRQRWSAFDDSHAVLAPYTSLTLRLICSRRDDLDTFRALCRAAHTQVDDSLYPAEYRDLFADAVRSGYEDWVSGLPWIVAFQVEALARSHVVDMRELLRLRLTIDRMIMEHKSEITSACLHDFLSKAKAIFWLGDRPQGSQDSLQRLFDSCQRDFLSSPFTFSESTSDDIFQCLHVIVTPTTMYLEGPFPERSNRVMRNYKENQDSFLRVSFVDETRLSYRFDREIDGRSFVKRRVLNTLINGLFIAGRHFHFLAYSQSALKEHAVWFVKPFRDPNNRQVDAATIIASLGSFRDLSFDPLLVYCPARYAARISQAFTATDSSISVEVEEVFQKDDIKDSTGKYCFTDGVGTISPELARAIWNELRMKRRRARRAKTYPRLFQIRFMGSKGMLSVDHRLHGREIVLRPSMIKFDAPNSLVIEVARAFDRPGKYYLNRPLIMLLEGLGVPYEVFQTLQDDAVRDAQDAVLSLESSARLVEAYGLGASFRLTSTMLSLHKQGLGPLAEDIFWQQMMDFAVNHVLRELKHHARIPLPDGYTLVGVADVHGYLREGEIFACIVSSDYGADPIYLEGPTLISRSPTIHPGDVQVVHAIGRPPRGSPFEKESLRNGVVFSIRGERPLPSCLGGGDLDGDVYNVTTMPSLRPMHTYMPDSYEAAERKTVDHPSTMNDVAEFVAEYINSDTLGIIAINWLIIADQSRMGILDPDCLKLARLHSNAVDYPKSGNPVSLEEIPRLHMNSKPDWNAPETLTRETPDYYKSMRAIGRLYRSIELPALKTAARASRFQRRHLEDGEGLTLDDVLDYFQFPDARDSNSVQLAVAQRISEFIPIPEHIDEAMISKMWELFRFYAVQLRRICADHTLSESRSSMLTEEEAVVGSIVAKCSQHRKRKDLMSRMREQTANLVSGIRAEISGDDDVPAEQSLERAWIAYNVALSQDDFFGARSFAWVTLGEIFDAIRDIEEEDRRLLR